jgi:spermidine synthase
VVEDRRERRLIVAGDILSVYPLNGDWSRLDREYWARAVAAAPRRRHGRALLVGLGGGTQVHLLARQMHPRLISVIERDPAIIATATRWFGLDVCRGLEFLCGDAERVVPWLATTGRRFDFIMEDAAYAGDLAQALPLALALAPLVAPRGVMVINRHRRRGVDRLVAALRPLFGEVTLRRVRTEGENVLVSCARPRRRRTSAREQALVT